MRVFVSIGLGFILGLANLYLGLRLGFNFGVAILAACSWVLVDRSLKRLFSSWQSPSSVDYACYLSLASAMSYGCGTVIATSLAALVLSEAVLPNKWLLALWLSAVCGLGSWLTIPLRRQMLARLPFPSGQSAACTVKAFHEGESLKAFGWGMGLAAAWVWLRDGLGKLPRGLEWNGFSWVDFSPSLFGVGALIGVRVCASLVAGSLCVDLLPPLFMEKGDAREAAMWPALGLMAAAGVWSLAGSLKNERTGGFGSAKALLKQAFPNQTAASTGVGLAVILLIVHIWFWRTPWWLIALLPLGLFLFALIACRVTGETDIVPSGQLGKISLLGLGFLMPGRAAHALAYTGALTGAAAVSADYMTDMRMGEQLGCPPQRQMRYQMIGAIVGPLMFVPLFMSLLNRIQLGVDWPAPAAQIWLQVAQIDFYDPVFRDGHGRRFLYGLAVGFVWAWLAERSWWRRFGPTPVAFALAIFLDTATSVSLLLGSLASWHRWGRGRDVFWCALIAGAGSMQIVVLLI